jgi:uncharacterized membrane protein
VLELELTFVFVLELELTFAFVFDLELTFVFLLDLELTFAFVSELELTFLLVIVSFVVALMFGGVDEAFVVCGFGETSLFTCSVAALFTDVSELKTIPI